jgi:hypothetical protein
VAKKRRSSNYTIGYRRPPKDTQFKPGKSGNPTGRPKGSRPVGAILKEILGRKVSVTENGKTRRLGVMEVIFHRLINDAMRGNPKAVTLLLSLHDRYGEAPQSSLQLDELLAEDREILAQYLNRRGNPKKK